MIQGRGNSTVLTLIYAPWCKFSQEFLPEFDKLAGHLYKLGELTDNIFFAKIDSDREPSLAKQFDVDGLPSLFLEQFTDGESEGRVTYDGIRTADEVYKFIRGFRPMVPEVITSSEKLQRLRNQLSHHLVVGLLHDKSEAEVEELIRGFTEIQTKN